MTDHAQPLRALFRAERQGLLSTLSVRYRGAPFGSALRHAILRFERKPPATAA